MIDWRYSGPRPDGGASPGRVGDAPITDGAAEIGQLRARLLALAPAPGQPGLVDQIDQLERLKAAAAAQQARLTADLDTRRAMAREAQRLIDEAEGTTRLRRPHPDAGLGIEIGLARRESPYVGRAKLSLARALVHDLPCTLAALEAGDLNERRAHLIATETADLSREDRLAVDTAVCGDPDALAGVGDAHLRDVVCREVLRRDEDAALARRARARSRRKVTGRILGDGIARISATIPVESYSSIIRSLDDAAGKARATGDDRTRGQLVADIFVQRLGGPGTDAPAPVALKLLVSAETLLGDDPEPGYLLGAGFLPASVTRSLAAQAVDHLRSSLQRIFCEPATGDLVTMESAQPLFRGALAEFITLRDRRCRTPYCNAPIRHTDHVRSRARGGRSSRDNGQGLCEACNYTKETNGWRHEAVDDSLVVTETALTTPTGHRHRSHAPRPPIPT